MYLLFVDESGTHGGSPVFVLGGLAIHEDDAELLQKKLDGLVVSHLGRTPPNLDEYELHASEMRNAKKPRVLGVGSKPQSVWSRIERTDRLKLLGDAYQLIANYVPRNEQLPVWLFSVVLDARFRGDLSTFERERFAYEILLQKFDVMLKALRVREHLPNRGLVIHDRRVVAERDIQGWTSEWRRAAGTVGQLRNLADVPLFADSRATRLLQAADLVSYAVFRRYSSPSVRGWGEFETLWPLFHTYSGATHGCVHFTPDFGQGSCDCPPCSQRLEVDGVTTTAVTQRRRRTRMGQDLGELGT